MALEKEIDRIIDSYKGDDGGLSDFIKTKFEDVDLDNDDASETDSLSSEEEEPAINRKRKSVSDPGKKPFRLDRSGCDRDYILQEISLNSSILTNSKSEVSNSEPDAIYSSSNQENPVLLKEVIKKLDAMETKNERYFKYLSTRMRAIERKCEKEQPAPSSFNDEEIDGVTRKFRLSEISMKNPNRFLRRYTELKYGKKYVESHVFDCDQGHRSERTAAPEDVVADLKRRLRQCFIIEGCNFGSVWMKARDSLNNHGRELKHKHKK